DRIFAVPDRAPFEGDLQDVRHMPARAIKELEKFFEATDALEAKTLTFKGWRGPAAAVKTIPKLAGERARSPDQQAARMGARNPGSTPDVTRISLRSCGLQRRHLNRSTLMPAQSAPAKTVV